MEKKFYSLKCYQLEESNYYEMSKDSFLFKGTEDNYVLYSSQYDNEWYYFINKKTCIIFHYASLKVGDIICTVDKKKKKYYIYMGIFTCNNTNIRLFVVYGRGFSSKEEAVSFYDSIKNESEADNFSFETNYNGYHNVYTRIKPNGNIEQNSVLKLVTRYEERFSL